MVLSIPKPKPRLPPIKDLAKFWAKGDRSRLPDCYKKHFTDMRNRKDRPIHYIEDERKWIVDHENGVWERVKNIPIPIMYPKQADQGLWGGEGLIAGYYITTNKELDPHAKVWYPYFMKLIFYSEMLDRHYALVVTRTTIAEIEKAEGFDEYILKTHPNDLKSRFAVELKKEMLHLLNKPESIRPDDPEKSKELYERFKEFIVPPNTLDTIYETDFICDPVQGSSQDHMKEEEEIDWMGLDIREALKKLYAIEAKEHESKIRPWKDVYQEELVKILEARKRKGVPIEAASLLSDASKEEKLSTSFVDRLKSVWK